MAVSVNSETWVRRELPTLVELVDGWRAEADQLESRGLAQPAGMLRSCAGELEEALRQHALEGLTPARAAEEKGCDPSTIRRRFRGRKTITRAELYGRGVDGPDLATAILQDGGR